MAIGSGLSGQVGVAAETVFGTYVAATRFPEVDSAPFDRKPNFAQGGGLAAGRNVRPKDRYVLTYREAEGRIEMEVTSKGFGLFVNQLFGGTATVVQQGATAAWLQTHILGDNKGKSMSIQLGLPSTNGTVNPYTYLGCKTKALSLECGVGDILKATLDYDAQDYSEAQGLATASYLVGVRPFNFADMNVKLGTFGSEAAVTGVRKVSLKVERGLKTDMQYAGAGGKKAEPVINAFTDITGTIETDFATKADFADRAVLAAQTSLVWEFVGPIIASTFAQTFRVTLPATAFTSGDPQIDSTDVLNPTFNFVALDDLTNPPIKIEIMSTDTAI